MKINNVSVPFDIMHESLFGGFCLSLFLFAMHNIRLDLIVVRSEAGGNLAQLKKQGCLFGLF
jgi:hypothetical protein